MRSTWRSTSSAASGKTVTVNYAATGGTAVSPDDYTISGTSLTFTAGETSKNVPLTVVDDAAVESDETVIVTLSGPVNATLGANTAYTYTIQDNEVPAVQFQATSSSGGEATTPANLAVTLNHSSSQTVTVQYAVTGGTAISGSDFTLPGGGGGQQVIALKRDAGLLAGGVLDSRFASLTSGNVVTATVKDAGIWPSGNTAEYYNMGTTASVGGYAGDQRR